MPTPELEKLIEVEIAPRRVEVWGQHLTNISPWDLLMSFIIYQWTLQILMFKQIVYLVHSQWLKKPMNLKAEDFKFFETQGSPNNERFRC